MEESEKEELARKTVETRAALTPLESKRLANWSVALTGEWEYQNMRLFGFGFHPHSLRLGSVDIAGILGCLLQLSNFDKN
ncbi:hypothetical protein V6N13_128054 [Hibiscus sabdariffa]|uniref:Uncharacterized protein n=2 Tax=Hibiscus sabdariffa TaxID=183260 RepID=A0ABR1ZJY5_9ROSI